MLADPTTAQALDDDMTRRIEAHRAERPADWGTLESPIELAAGLDRALAGGDAAAPYDVVVIDCMTLWVSNILLALPDADDVTLMVAGLELPLRSSSTLPYSPPLNLPDPVR